MSAINYSQETIKTVQNFVTSLETVSSNSNNTTEFEIRFGKFNFDKSSNKYKFDTNSNVEFFYRLKNAFKKQNYKYEIINTIESIYENSENLKGSIKKIFNKDTNLTTYIIKNTFKKYDVYDYDLRFSLASEKKINKTYLDKMEIDHEKFNFIREKTRCSFQLTFGKLDLTIVKENKNQKYEIELEIYKNANLEEIFKFLTLILQISSQNYFITSKNEKKQIINEYKHLVNSYFFIGAQPETLHKNQIVELYKNEYSVTDKADGERAFLFVDKNGMVFLIDNNMDVFNKTNIKINNFNSCLIDGEKVLINNKIHFMAFDLLVLNGQDIRGKNEFLLKERLFHTQKIMNEIVKTIDISNLNNLYDFSTKQFIFKNVFIGAEIILNNIDSKPYKNDGLIFTPINEPYPTVKKWSKLLKWKPSEQNTIDFYSVKISNNEWELYVQEIAVNYENIQESKPKQQLVLFDVDKLCPETKTVDAITFKTNFDETLIDPTTEEAFQTNTVIEFYWDFKLKQFMPSRTRWDKTVNKKKHGNFKTVACDIWNNIHSPIDKEFLCKFSTPGNKDDIYFHKMRKYHNKIKEYLYNKYANKSNSLLELCSGRGGDMHKWIFNDIKKVVGYDISSKNIEECIKRMNQLKENNKLKSNSQYEFHNLDLSKSDSFKKIDQEFENVFCNFGIHYFFESKSTFESILNILDKSLKLNGYFVITFIDDKKLYELFENKKSIFKIDKNSNEVCYYMNTNLETQSDMYGNKLKIVLNGNNILGEGSNEFIINFEKFCKLMKENKFQLVETQLFENIYKSHMSLNLTETEKEISFLNRYCIFQKLDEKSVFEKPLDSTKIKSNYKKINNPKVLEEKGFNNIILHNNDLSAIKISCTYDILNILNCIEYKYYKNEYNNVVINEMEDIKNIIEDCKINLDAIFVADIYKFENTTSNKKLHFTNFKNITEKKEKDSNEIEIQEEIYWYILLNKNNILFEWPEIILQSSPTEKIEESNQECESNEECQEQITEKIEESNEEQKENIKNKILKMKENNEKFTIKTIKPLLEELNLKTSGKKEELLNRLMSYLNLNGI
jgi:hypothetical protein